MSHSRPSTQTRQPYSRQGNIKTENPELLSLLGSENIPGGDSHRSQSVKPSPTPRTSRSLKNPTPEEKNLRCSEDSQKNTPREIEVKQAKRPDTWREGDTNNQNERDDGDSGHFEGDDFVLKELKENHESQSHEKESEILSDQLKNSDQSQITDVPSEQNSEKQVVQPQSQTVEKSDHCEEEDFSAKETENKVGINSREHDNINERLEVGNSETEPSISENHQSPKDYSESHIHKKCPSPQEEFNEKDQLVGDIQSNHTVLQDPSSNDSIDKVSMNDIGDSSANQIGTGEDSKQLPDDSSDNYTDKNLKSPEPDENTDSEAELKQQGEGAFAPDRETLKSAGSSSSELARLQSPSRKSLNVDFDSGSKPSSPEVKKEQSEEENEDSGSTTPIPEEQEALQPTVVTKPESFQHPAKSLTPRFTTYSSQRLKARGDTAKRPTVVNQNLSSQDEDQSLTADSLDIERDSLELTKEDKEENGANEELKDKHRISQDSLEDEQLDEDRISQDSLQRENENKQTVETSGIHNTTTPIKSPISELASSESPVPDTNHATKEHPPGQGHSQSPRSLQAPELSIVNEGKEIENKGDQPLTEKTPTNSPDPNLVDPEVEKENSVVNALDVLSVNPQERDLEGPSQDPEPSPDILDERDQVEFVIKAADPTRSRYTSAQGSGRFSTLSSRDTSGVNSLGGRRSSRTTPASKKVYVESPTFTREEEDEYRFVLSRLEGEEGEGRPDTYREMDIAAVQRSGFPEHAQPPMDRTNRTGGEKRVRYSDINDRYEDREPDRMAFHEGVDENELVNENTGFPNRRYSDRFEGQPQGQITHSGAGNDVDGTRGEGARRDLYQRDQPPQQPPQHYRNNNDARGVSPPLNAQTTNYNNDGTGEVNPKPSRAPPAALSLPVRQDPEEEEELRRESEYQAAVRHRMDDTTRRVSHIHDPRTQTEHTQHPDDQDQNFAQNYPPQPHYSQGHPQQMYQHPQQMYQHPNQRGDLNGKEMSQDFPQDSLEYGGGDPGGEPLMRRDSLDLYPRRRQDSQDFDQTGVPQSRFNSQVQPRFYHQGSQQNQQPPDFYRSNQYGEGPYQQQPFYPHQQQAYYPHQQQAQQQQHPYYQQQQYYNQQPHPQQMYFNDINDGNTTSRSAPMDDDSDIMEAVRPFPPKYDYITHNKEDYGKKPPASYQKLHQIGKEEKDRANEMFIKPKVKTKGILKKRGNANSQWDGHESAEDQTFGNHGEPPMLEEEMSAAEQLWANRASSLASGSHQGKRGRGRGRGQLNQANRAARPPHFKNSQPQVARPQQHALPVPPPSQQPQAPPPGMALDKRAFLTEMPTPVQDPNQGPHSPRQYGQDIVLQPITQQVITDDGQRISVDVNLRLISPPPAGAASPGQQYPHQQHQYSEYDRQPRQYPASVAQYDARGDRYLDMDYDAEVDNYTRPGGAGRGYQDFQAMDYVTPRERYSADEALRTLSDSRTEVNPFGKIPPIPRSSDGLPSSAPADQGGSYMEAYLRDKNKDQERPWYRVYGLRDYRKMQKEVRLGTLGPDLESTERRERKEKVNRQNDYARAVMERNRSNMNYRKPPAFPRPKENNDIMNRTKVAKEYAKSVPKPTVRLQPNEFNNYEIGANMSPIAKHHRRIADSHTTLFSTTPYSSKAFSSPSPSKNSRDTDVEVLSIDKLKQRYEEDKQNEAMIRRNTNSREHY